jgi:hypothetical protein
MALTMRCPPAHSWLDREERRALVRERDHVPNGNMVAPATPECLYCYGPLANGRAVCSDPCDTGWWEIVPTISGELWGTEPPEPRKQTKAEYFREYSRKRRARIKAEKEEAARRTAPPVFA